MKCCCAKVTSRSIALLALDCAERDRLALRYAALKKIHVRGFYWLDNWLQFTQAALRLATPIRHTMFPIEAKILTVAFFVVHQGIFFCILSSLKFKMKKTGRVFEPVFRCLHPLGSCCQYRWNLSLGKAFRVNPRCQQLLSHSSNRLLRRVIRVELLVFYRHRVKCLQHECIGQWSLQACR